MPKFLRTQNARQPLRKLPRQIAVASIGTPLVSRTESPGRAPRGVTNRRRSTSPTNVPTRIGRYRPCVISVCPPIYYHADFATRGVDVARDVPNRFWPD